MQADPEGKVWAVGGGIGGGIGGRAYNYSVGVRDIWGDIQEVAEFVINVGHAPVLVIIIGIVRFYRREELS